MTIKSVKFYTLFAQNKTENRRVNPCTLVKNAEKKVGARRLMVVEECVYFFPYNAEEFSFSLLLSSSANLENPKIVKLAKEYLFASEDFPLLLFRTI